MYSLNSSKVYYCFSYEKKEKEKKAQITQPQTAQRGKTAPKKSLGLAFTTETKNNEKEEEETLKGLLNKLVALDCYT